jgi:dTDP-4-amino-4,6-dideoxygalactose transaminase
VIFRCDLVPQYNAYKKEIHAAMERVLNSGRYILANEGAAFETEFAAYQRVGHAAGVANATDGLILTLKALGIGTGDEVITTPFTAIPTLSAIVASGAKPVFVDIDPDTYLIDLAKIKKSITKKTRAVMPVHIFGNVADIAALKKMVGKKIAVIEDSAQAHGSRRSGVLAGSMGDAAVFSFYPTKNLGAYGDGGMVVSNDKKLIDKIKLLRMYGMVDKDHIAINGVNSRLDELQAAILRVKLPHLDDMNERRNAIAALYKKELRADLFEHQQIDKTVYSNFHVFAARFKKNRTAFIAYLDKAGIQTNVYYPLPLHLQQASRSLGKKKGAFPVAEALCRDVIALPMYPELEFKTCEHIIRTINEFQEPSR